MCLHSPIAFAGPPLPAPLRAGKGSGPILVEGRVMSETGAAIQGAKLELLTHSLDPFQTQTPVAETWSDSQGLYQVKFRCTDECPSVILVTRDGYAPVEHRLVALRVKKDYRMPEAVASLTARVIGESGKPLEGSLVFVGLVNIVRPGDLSGPAARWAFTDRTGRARIEGLPKDDDVIIQISARRHRENRRFIPLLPGENRLGAVILKEGPEDEVMVVP